MPTSEEVVREFTHGWFERGQWQQSLLGQLSDAYQEMKSTAGDTGTRGAKPKSRPPLDITAMEFYYDCCTEVMLVQNGKSDQTLRRFRLTARHKFGYDAAVIQFASSSCHVCHSILEGASDASSNIICTNPECGYEYEMKDWANILQAKGEADV